MSHRLLITAAALALLPACRREPAHARIDAAIAPLLPPDCVALAGLRLDRLRGTEFSRRFIEQPRIAPLLDFQRRTALSPAQDVWEAVWCLAPARSMVFFRGKFGGQFGLEPRFDAPGIHRRSYKGYYVLEKDGLAVLFITSGVAVLGKAADLESIVDGRDRPDETPPQALIDAVAALPACHFWAVMRAGAVLPAPAALPLKGAPLFDSSGQASLYAVFTDHWTLDARATYPTEPEARSARDGLAATLGMLGVAGRRLDPRWVRLAAAVRLQVQGREVQLSAALRNEDVERLLLAPATSSAPESRRRD